MYISHLATKIAKNVVGLHDTFKFELALYNDRTGINCLIFKCLYVLINRLFTAVV